MSCEWQLDFSGHIYRTACDNKSLPQTNWVGKQFTYCPYCSEAIKYRHVHVWKRLLNGYKVCTCGLFKEK